MSHALLIALAVAASPLTLHPDFDPVAREVGPSDDELYALVEGPGDAVYMAGTAWGSDGRSSLALVRVDAFGRVDRGFADDGVFHLRSGERSAGARALAVDGRGRLLVGGYAFGDGGRTDLLLARVHPDGSLDEAFNGGAPLTLDLGPASSGVNALVVDAEDRAILVGYRRTELGLLALAARVDERGALDPGFGDGGFVELDVQGDLDELVDVALDDEGRIVAVGRSHLGYSDRSQILVVRLLEDGALDPDFADAGVGLYTLGPYGFDEGTSLFTRAGRVVVGATVEVGQLAGDLDLGVLTLDDAGAVLDRRVFSLRPPEDGGATERLSAIAPGPDDAVIFAGRSGSSVVVGALSADAEPAADLELQPCSAFDQPVDLATSASGDLWLGFRCWQGFEHDFGLALLRVPPPLEDQRPVTEADGRVEGPVLRPEIEPATGCACGAAAPADAGLLAALLLGLRALSSLACRARRRRPCA